MNSCFYSATACMPHHHNQVCSEMLNCVLNAAQLMIIDNISGHPDYKQLSDPRRKYTLRNHP